jgi:hypothetical protein
MPSPMDRFMNLIGGEQNLPPKRIPTPPPAPSEDDNGDIAKLPTVEEIMAKYPIDKPSYLNKSAGTTPQHLPSQHKNPSHVPPPLTAEERELFKFDPRCGESSPRGLTFSPFAAVTKYCYKFLDKEYSQLVATAFFDEGKIFNREWDLYVLVHHKYSHITHPIERVYHTDPQKPKGF